MQSARFDFESLQPSILRMIRSARSHLHRHSSEDGENTHVKNGTDSISTVRATSRRRSEAKSSRGHRLTRSRSSLGQEVSSENAAPEKPQVATASTSVLGDATNTYSYSTGHRPSNAIKTASPTKPKTTEQRFPQGLPVPPAADMGELDGMSVHPDDPQYAAEYAQDIFQILKLKESTQLVSPTYMDRQVHVTAKMRAILLDWLVDVHKKYKLRAETLFLAVQIIDRYLEIQAVQRCHLQLVGATSLLIAAKFEEVYPPKIKEFEYVTDKAYTRDEILKMEVCILKALKFNICCPTAMNFLDRYQSANGCTDAHKHLAQYLLELSLVEYKMLKYGPSHLAAAAILLSNKLLRRPSWTPTLVRYTSLTEPVLKDCAKELCALLENAEASPLQATRKKFSQLTFHSVAKLNFMAGHSQTAVSMRRSSTGGAGDVAQAM